MEVHALASGIRLTPRKARLVAATVVGLPVNEALTVLKFTPRYAAADVAKVIKSAAANAEHNYELDVDTLRVARIEVDGARVIKRFRPRAQGRAFTILKKTVHVRAVVTDEGYESLSRKVKANSSPDAQTPRRRRGTVTRATAAAPAPRAAEKPARGRAKAADAEAKPAARRGKRATAAEAGATEVTKKPTGKADSAKAEKAKPSSRTKPASGKEAVAKDAPEKPDQTTVAEAE